MIGLLDLDWSLSTSNTFLFPNIEIMKLASYYKIEENQFCRLLTLEDNDLTPYEKIYIFSELHSNLNLPPVFLRHNDIVFGGSALTNGEYIPFKNELIDYTIPRTAIYKEVLKQKYSEGVKAKIISHVLDNTYYRNYAGSNKLPLPAVIPRKQVLLYDVNFFYSDWKDTIQEISNRKPSTILRIHPIVCTKLSQYFDVRKFNKIARSNIIILDINIPLEDVNYMLRNYKNLFLADIVANSNVCLYLGGTWPTTLQYCRDLIYKLNLLLAFWSRGINIKFYYLQPKIGTINPLADLDKAAVQWSGSMIKTLKLIDKIPKKKKKNNYLKEQYDEVLKFFPNAKALFEQSFEEISKRGYWNL